ncbi:hypothetical protein GCM10022224_042140 [Nonomuraea antimicrobica]|uniref:Uncharacterized protein n=1 Tax=Nonomuraea antimicrobica TaxID=561173 RepID=A0ABP7C1C4_9ACTN
MLSLQSAAAGGREGVEETSVRAPAKVIAVLPPRLRELPGGYAAAFVPTGSGSPPPRATGSRCASRPRPTR